MAYDKSTKAIDKVRTGKTERDRASGAPQRRADNRRAREAFMQQTKSSPEKFPTAACNGKKNRHRWTGKNGNTIVR